MTPRPVDRPARDREQERMDERARLFRSAYAVMRRNGYAGANITDILADAELGTRAFYRHFASKDELLLSMFRENAERTAADLDAKVRAAVRPVAALEAWIDAILDMGYSARTTEVARLFASGPVRSTFEDAGDEAVALLIAPLRRVLVEGAASGTFPTCDAEADASTIHAIVWQLFTAAMQGGSTLDRAGARAHALRFVRPALGLRRSRGA